MDIQSISNVLNGTEGISSNKTQASSSFSSILNDALDNALQTEEQNQTGTLELLAGQNDSIHTAMIQSEEATLALNLVIQIRNKVLDSYNEIMRMQV